MCQASANNCANCQRLQQQVQTLQEQLQQQQQALASVLDELRQVKERLAGARKDSSTSSKPPSSDIVKPGKGPAPADSPPRQGGGQPGHAKHTRTLFSLEELSGEPQTHRMTHCPNCRAP